MLHLRIRAGVDPKPVLYASKEQSNSLSRLRPVMYTTSGASKLHSVKSRQRPWQTSRSASAIVPFPSLHSPNSFFPMLIVYLGAVKTLVLPSCARKSASSASCLRSTACCRAISSVCAAIRASHSYMGRQEDTKREALGSALERMMEMRSMREP